MKKQISNLLFVLVLCNLTFFAQAQSYYYSSSSSTYYYSREYVPSTTYNVSQNLSVDNAVDQTFNYLGRVLNDKKEKEAAQAQKEKMQKRVSEMRKYYESLGNYPTKVIDGWHEGVMVGSDEYIADAKFLVKNNKIIKMVWDDWLPQELNFSGPIMKCKSGIRIKDGKGPLEGMVDVMFINFVADSTSTASTPLKAGKVTFWTNSSNFKNITVMFEDMPLNKFTHKFHYATPPACGGDNEIVVYFKPGLYTYKATKSNSWTRRDDIIIESKVRITEEGCELVQINKLNSMKD